MVFDVPFLCEVVLDFEVSLFIESMCALEVSMVTVHVVELPEHAPLHPAKVALVPGDSLRTIETVDVKVVWDPVWTMDRLAPSAREKLTMPLEELEPYRNARSAV